jgi:hypothetical protein
MRLDKEKFEKLLAGGENDIVDFKVKHYFDPNNISDKEKTSEFVKDILCMANTVRSESAYILIGVEEDEYKKGKVIGIQINEIIDDATLQQKVKNKVYPSLKFESYVFNYNEQKVFIVEIPVSWYQSMPLPTSTQKGLETGRVYLRRKSSNDFANPEEIIRLNEWLKSLSMLPDVAGRYISLEEQVEKFKIKPKFEKSYPIKITFDEVSIQKLFGNEAAENEDVTRLKEYYFKNDAYENVVVDLPIRILVGHKGIGKSALFKIAAANDIDKNCIPIIIKPDDVSDLAKSEDDFLKMIRIWKVGLTELIQTKLLYFLEINEPEILPENKKGNFRIRQYLSNFLSKIRDDGIVPENLIPFMDNFISDEPINIYIDDLDRGWIGGKKDITRLSALLNAIRDLSDDNLGLQFKISLRSDVYYLIRTSDESTDKIGSSVVWYSWTNHQILVMLIKRIETYFGREVNEKTLMDSQQRYIAYFLDTVLENRYKGRGKWEDIPMYRVLMSLIRKRPRDLVKLLTLAARVARRNGQNIIMSQHLKEIFDEYSQDRLQDAINEYRSELPDIERLLLGMRPTSKGSFTINRFAFKTHELMKKINDLISQGKFMFSSGKEADAKDLAQFLYKINFLTARKELATGEIDRKYFEEYRYATSRYADFGYDWEIHMAYRWALQPITFDDFFDTLNSD